jgi:acyl-CoA synthetase (AMP-forming)/AMP-acid ligase II
MITSSADRIKEYTDKGWWADDTFHSLVESTSRLDPERLAVADPPNKNDLSGGLAMRLSYGDLDVAANHLAEQLLSAGAEIEETLIIQLPNVVELVVSYLAASKIGAILSPIPVQYGAHELTSISKVLGATKIISCASFRGESLASTDSDLTKLLFGGGSSNLRLSILLDRSDTGTPLLDQHRQDHASVIGNANSIFTICWTSGTTGTPKGVPRSHNMWLATTKSEVQACDFKPGDRLLNPFPLINMAALGGFLYPWAMFGCSLYLHHPLDPAIFLQQCQEEKINFTIAPPALLNQLAQSPEMWQQFDFSALRRIGSGSAPLAPSMIDTFSRVYGKEIINFYGSNEGICLLADTQTAPTPEQRASMFPRLGMVGLPWQGEAFNFAKTKVVDTTTGIEILEAGIPGELMFAGPTIFDGYYDGDNGSFKKAEGSFEKAEGSFKKAEGSPSDDGVFDEDGYFHTGDLVEICGEQNRYYRIVGRCKDIINRGGMKISPSEIDQVLEGMPGLKEVAVCAYADDRLGEKVCACIVPIDKEETPDLAAMVAYLEHCGLAKYKMPERLEVFDALPRNPMGKVLRFELSDSI